jgi:uncharacterized protein (DUF2141 family)
MLEGVAMKVKVFLVAGLLLALGASAATKAQTEPPPADPAGTVPADPAASAPVDPSASAPDATGEAPAEVPGTVLDPNLAVVHVIAENVESAKGTVWLALCNTSLTVEGCPYKASAPAAAGFVEVSFENIPPGIYAVVGYHDVNGDDQFNRTLGVPREPYALSGAAGEMLAPDFEDATIEIKPGMNDVILRLGRLVG